MAGAMSKVTLRQLEVFDAVATLGSLTNAADRLGMSQSAASTALNDLQTILRRPLFAHVRGKPLRITDEGRHVQSIIRSVLSGVRDIEIPRDASLRGKIVIGASAMIAERLLPSICAKFLAIHSDVQIRIEIGTSVELFDRLERLELEAALIENSSPAENIELTAWRSDELWLVVGTDHPLTRRSGLTIADLTGARWCMREMRSNTASRLRWLLHEKLGQLPLAMEVANDEALRQATINGAGIACLSRILVEGDVAAGRLVRLDVADFRFTRVLSLARPRDVWRGQLATAFETFLLASADRRVSAISDGCLPDFENCMSACLHQ
jgi:DNA-binding transcriptional LysR family regulator